MDASFELNPQREEVGQSTAQRNFSVGFLKGNSLTSPKNVVVLPYAVETLVENHVPVFTERKLGEKAGFSDLDYADSGAEIEDNAVEICKKVDILVSLAPFSDEEVDAMKKQQIIISPFSDADATTRYFEKLKAKGITALSFRFVKTENGNEQLETILHQPEGNIAASAYLSDFLLSLIFPLILNSNIRYAVQTNPLLLKAIYCYKGILANKIIGENLNLPWKDLLLLCWDWN